MMEKPRITTDRRALAQIQYNNILAEQATSSDEDLTEFDGLQGDDARRAIGVSIGHEQTRLTSPKTPAVEKAAALERAGGFFGGRFDGAPSGILEAAGDYDGEDHESPDEPLGVRNAGEPSDLATESRLPSPWKAESKEAPRSNKTRSVLRDGFSFGRRRASSGPDSGSSSRYKSFLPSMPKAFSLTAPFANSRDAETKDKEQSRNRNSSSRRSTFGGRPGSSSAGTSSGKTSQIATPTATRSPTRSGTRSPREAEEAEATVADLPRDLQLQHVRSRPGPMLRRSTSDNSLITQRTLSRVSSLGDDTRFEDVSAQVNSRFKAIKDSFQDSSIKLPSMPSISNFSVASFTPDFLSRDRSASSSFKQSQYGADSMTLKHPPKPVDPITRQPYVSAKAAFADAPGDKSKVEHPNFKQALDDLEGDIVILGGYRGSILRSAEPPHRQLWVPIKVGLNLRKVDLEVGLNEDDDEKATEKVIPGGMLTHIGPVDISRRLFKRLRSCENAKSGKLRVHDYGYDWRLHPTHLSKQLIAFLESLPCNQPGSSKNGKGATVIAHSLGGLITRHAVNQRPELFKGVVYAGVPKTCVNILGPLRNGDEVLLSDRVLTAQVNFTIRTSFALLPLNGRCFFDKNTREEYPVDFFDPQTWVDYRLSPCIARPLPPISSPPKPTGISSYVNSVANALPSLPIRARKGSKPIDPSTATNVGGVVEAPDTLNTQAANSSAIAANGNIAQPKTTHAEEEKTAEPSVRTAVTIPPEDAMEYLTRTLRTVKKFKQDLAFRPEHQDSNIYPPISVIYGKSTPTVFGAKVDGEEGIKHADAYDELAFASGDGVVLAKAAMVPEGYRTARGGVVSSERGHVTLLGDLEAVGRCLLAVGRARGRGVGLGKSG